MAMKDALEAVTDVVDEVTDPKQMARAAYIPFLEELIAELEGRLEAARDDAEEEEG